MNTSAIGRRLEHRVREDYERAGLRVVRSAASKGAFDLIAFDSNGAVFIQCKRNKARGREFEEFKALKVPPLCIKVWAWKEKNKRGGVQYEEIP